MKKQTKVLLAAALFTLGASFSSMAALKNGTWVLNEDGWQYADKEGEYVEEEWCVSYGTEYWINDEGVLGASEWVTDGDYTYYVQSDGSKTVNAWKYLYAEDDEDADEESWFYFDSKGRMVKSAAKTIGDYKYYFDADGKMLTGWIDTEGYVSAEGTDTNIDNIVYADESGARVNSSWINMYPWTMEEDEAYEDDYEYFYATSDGTLKKDTKTKIDGLYYIFDNNGVMLSGWVQEINDIYTDADAAISADTQAAYFCDEDYGYVKLNSWRELDDPTGEDDTYWYHFDKTGKAFIATEATGSDAKVANEANFADGEDNEIEKGSDVIVNAKKIDGIEYYFNQKGEMIDGLQYIDGDLMYLEDGARQTGKVTITDDHENDYTFYFAEKTDSSDKYKKYVAVEGNMDGYCYKQGQLQTSDDKDVYRLVETDNGKFIVDYRGKIQHKDGKEYEGVTGVWTFNADADGAVEDSIKGAYVAQ